MYYPTLQDVKSIIKQLNKRYDMNVVIINEGQLQFALEKPKMVIFDHQQWPELYQKAAILMETVTKAHTLSDGNKRTAMLIAELMIKSNGAELVLPLKAIRLSVDTAMDDSDSLSDTIQQWFKVHTAMNVYQLCAMFYEHIEEETIIKKLLQANKSNKIKSLLSKWMAFDSYPEKEQEWDDLTKKWKQYEQDIKKKSENSDDSRWFQMWDRIMNIARREPERYSDYFDVDVNTIDNLRYYDNSMDELLKAEHNIKEQALKYEKSTDAIIIHHNGVLLQKHGNYHEAINEFEKLRRYDASEFDAVFHIAVIHLYNYDNSTSALQYLHICEKHQPNSSDVQLHIGVALVRLQRYDDALIYLEKVLKKHSDDQEAIFHKGICKQELKDYENALQCYEQNLDHNPKNADAYNNIAAIYGHMSEWEKSIEYANKGIELDPSNYHGYYNKGVTLCELQKFDEAIIEFKKAYELNPEYIENTINLGSSLSNSGNIEEGVSYLQQALEKNPSHSVALSSIALSLIRLKQFNTSLSYVKRLLVIEPNNQEGKCLESIIFANTGKILQSLDLIEELIRSSYDPQMISNAIQDGLFDPIKDSERFKKLTMEQI